jgi:hypothetical protein
MSQRLPTNPTDLVDPNKRGGAYIADLERRVAEIERFAVDQASAAVAGALTTVHCIILALITRGSTLLLVVLTF